MKNSIALVVRRAVLVVGLCSLLVWSCSDDDVDEPDVGDDVGAEDVATDTAPDDDPDVADDPDADAEPPPPDEWVDFDLEPYLDDAPDPEGSVHVYEVTDTADLIEGESATGRVGDYMLENEKVRFVVEQDERNISACPWGGNIIDAEARTERFGGDIMGEICLFLNADQTFKPEEFDIVHDGSDGPGVLAITGRTEILDFLNVESMIAQMVGAGMADLFSLRPDGLMPLRLTKFLILRPGDQGVRVVTALRNDGEEKLHIVASHLLVSGADGIYFNPLSSLGGFGYIDQGLADPDPDLVPFLALLNDDAGVAYLPEPDEEIEADLPVAGAYLTVFNVAASVLGRTDIINTLLANEQQIPNMDGLLHMEPGEVDSIEYWVYATDGELATMADVIYAEVGVETGAVEGVVLNADDEPVAGARVSAVDEEDRTMNQAITDGEGAYAMRLPLGDYELSARTEDEITVDPISVGVAEDDVVAADDITTAAAGLVTVEVHTPGGDPTPARVTLLCEGDCPHKTTSNEWDVTLDGLPEDWATVEWVGVSGELEFPVPEGDYRVVVSRGLEWSLWPEDVDTTGGELIEVVGGEATEIDAEIARVVDTTGAMSGDFHVHTISSLDSTTPHEDRVLTFLVEGIDVLVSSDHDEIVDYGPAAEAVGAEDEVATMIGTEVSYQNQIGHINGFPLTRDDEHRRGGAIDWGGGTDAAIPPSEVYDWIREFPGEQVVQLNHPDSSYLRYSDVVRGIAYGDPERMRVQAPDYDPETGDSGLWSEEFSAMELMNGLGTERFWGVTRWWLTLIGRGHKAAGTAVTDTHVRYGRILGGVPRTFVFVDDDKDSAASFDAPHFVDSVNRQKVLGTTGPFARVQATNDADETAGLGEVLETGGEAVTFEITVEVPEWIDVDRIEMLKNSDDVVTDPGEYDTDPIEPTETYDVEFDENDLEVVATGDIEHRRYRKTVEIEVETEADAYVVFLIRGSDDMYPVVPDDEIEPMAFTNPVYLDADGDGYNNPHLAELAASEPPESNPNMLVGDHTEQELRELSHEQLREIFESSHHHHGHGHGHHH